jgi:opacity protein-like surface antigen
MQKMSMLTSAFAVLFSTLALADTRPVVSISLGSDRATVYSTKTITFITPFQNSYMGTNHYDTEPVIGLFLGGENNFLHGAWQWGVSYFQSSSFEEDGNVNQFANPAFNNFTYQYQIKSRRVSLEGKLSALFLQIWRPYLSASAGEALNYAYAYTETPLSSAAVPMSPSFAGHTTKSFTYSAGIGIDVEVAEHLRVGAGYRYLNLGNASLGVTPLQADNHTMGNSHIHANEFLAQLTYIG